MHPLHHPLFVNFIVYFNRNQDYFECHETLEEYWKAIAPRDKKHPLTGYILLATGMYHWRRGNFAGARKTMRRAKKRLSLIRKKKHAFKDGIDFPHLMRHLLIACKRIHDKEPFAPFSIIVTDPELQKLVNKTNIPLLPAGSKAVIHKHMLRDRSAILQARNEKKKGRFQ